MKESNATPEDQLLESRIQKLKEDHIRHLKKLDEYRTSELDSVHEQVFLSIPLEDFVHPMDGEVSNTDTKLITGLQGTGFFTVR